MNTYEFFDAKSVVVCGDIHGKFDELPIAKLYKSGQVMFAKREALEWKSDLTMPSYEEWRNQMLGGLRPSDWDKFIVR